MINVLKQILFPRFSKLMINNMIKFQFAKAKIKNIQHKQNVQLEEKKEEENEDNN